MSTAPGATRAEWEHFARRLGLFRDLLPVVSEPRAVISPLSSLRALGKVPSRYNGRHEAVGIKDWTSLQASMIQVTQWSAVSDYGICLQTRSVRGLDVDTEVPEELERIEAAVFDHLGLVPCREREGSPRILYAFIVEESLKHRELRLPVGMVELLGDGQQFIAAGQHSKGGRYRWRGGLPESFPVVPVAALEELWAAIGGGSSQGSSSGRFPGAAGALVSLAPPADPVEAWLHDRGWIRGTGPDGEARIWCPWWEDHSGDSGPSETVYFPAGTGGYAAGHFRCVHAHCAGRRDEAFLDAVGFAADRVTDFEPVQPDSTRTTETRAGELTIAGVPLSLAQVFAAAPPGQGLIAGKKGFLACLTNVARALDTPGWWQRLGWDAFREELMRSPWDSLPEVSGAWTRLTDGELIEGRLRLEREHFEPVGRELIRDAVEYVARRRTFDAAQVWLGGCRWDGVPRVERWLIEGCGAVDTAYARAVSRYVWTALAGRVLVPGIQADMVPIFVSEQGARKTRGLESWAPWTEAYTTIDLSVRDAELARRMRGTVILELNELRGLHTRERQAINSFISERIDHWTPKYQEFATHRARRGLIIGTSNDEEILDDDTGHRRWLPLRVTRFGELTAQLREQLWAEGAQLFLSDGIAWADAERLAKAEHGAYRTSDIWDEDVAKWLAERNGTPFSLKDIAVGIGLDPRQVTKAMEMRLGKVLRRQKYQRVVRWSGEVEGMIRLWQSES